MNNVADKYGVKDFVKFKHMVKGCKWIESAGKWEVTVEDLVTRKTFVDMADCIINGNGLLNTPKYTYIKDADKFKGKVLHTARWDPDYDLRGKRVAVIGTGATAVQLIPKIQPVVAHMTILQRTPTWVPNYPLGGRYSEADKVSRSTRPLQYLPSQFLKPLSLPPLSKQQKFRSDPEFHKRYVDALFRMFESPALFLRNHKVQERMHRDTVARYEKDIKDPVLRAKLMPSFPLGCRRLTPSNSFLSAVQQPNVELNTDLIERCVEDGVILNVTGEHRKLDALIYATGYDNTLVPMFTVVGRNGNTLEKKWKDDIKSYLGIMTRDFPNYLMTLGPNGFPVGSALLAIEIQVDYIASLLQEMAFENLKAIEPKQSAEDSFDKEVWEYGEKTVMSQNCTTWVSWDATSDLGYRCRRAVIASFLPANSWLPQSPLQMKAKNGKVVGTFPGGVNEQINRMNHIDMNDYEVVKMGESKL